MATDLKSPELSKIAAAAFSDKWKSYTDEKQHARGFWSDFFRALWRVIPVAYIRVENREYEYPRAHHCKHSGPWDRHTLWLLGCFRI